ncbi:MAG: hypothetical protein JXB32_06300 [Deltaproteobacteria bacterium]|nr:hypothetical protein [Deltaproteobacteria bacterium]
MASQVAPLASAVVVCVLSGVAAQASAQPATPPPASVFEPSADAAPEESVEDVVAPFVETVPPPVDDLSRVLMIVPRSNAGVSERAVEAARAQLADLPVEIEVVWVETMTPGLREQLGVIRVLAAERGAGIAFWVDLESADEVMVYVAEPGGGRVLARAIDTGGQPEESRYEITALILRATIEALVQGGEIGVRMPELPDVVSPPVIRPVPAPPVAPPPPVEAVPVLELSGAYAPALQDDGLSVVHAGRLALTWRPAAWAGVFAACRLVAPFERENEQVVLSFEPHPFEIGFGVRWTWGDWRLDLSGALVNDVVSWSAQPRRDTVETRSPSWRWVVALAPEVAVRWSPLGNYALFAGLGMDFVLNDGPSVVDTPLGPATVVEPWPVRPFLRLGVEMVLL